MSYMVSNDYIRVSGVNYAPGEIIPAHVDNAMTLVQNGSAKLIEGDPPASKTPEPSEAAREAAKEEGIKIEDEQCVQKVEGTGKKGRVIKKDVKRAAAKAEAED